jgi:quinol-cytochrome oxidoreductase complex cytochrome b subunit
MGRAWQRDGVARARIVAVGVLTVELAFLGATGLWLTFYYVPSGAAVWSPLLHGGGNAASWSAAIETAHRVASIATVPTAIVAGVLVVLDARSQQSEWRKGRVALVAGPGLAVLVLMASLTGYLLPWDQLALWAVTVGTNMRGYTPVFGHSVKYVLIGRNEITTGTLWRWFVVHAMVLSVLLVGALVVAWRPRRRVEHHAGTSNDEALTPAD